MKCIKKAEKVVRVPEDVAAQRVKQGWAYCAKSEFKTGGNKAESIEKPVAEKREGPKVKRKRPNKEVAA